MRSGVTAPRRSAAASELGRAKGPCTGAWLGANRFFAFAATAAEKAALSSRVSG